MYIRVQQFCQYLRKLNIIRSELVESKILRPVYEELFFNILLRRVLILLQSFQKVMKTPKKLLLKKSKWLSKNAEFYAEYKTAGKSKY